VNPEFQPVSPRSTRREFLRRASLAGLAMTAGLPGRGWALPHAQLHIRSYNDLASLDPPFLISAADSVVGGALFQTLLQFKPDGTWDTEPDAAEYFEQIDETHYAFRLKPGQMFSDGFGEMTADDVKFSFERMVDPAINAINAPDMGPLSHVEVHDRYSGTIVLHSPYAAFIPVAVASYSGSIMSRKAVMSAGGRFGTQAPCASGPYRFRSWQAKRKTILERNPVWQGPRAAFEEIHVYAMSDDKAAEFAFEAGELDCTQISIESTGAFEKDMPPDSHVEILPSLRNYWIGINQANPDLRDVRVRRAIQYAIDVEAVLEAAWFGQAKPSTGPIPEGMLGHRDYALIPPRGNTETARALLRESGVELPLRLRLEVNSNSLELTAVQVIQWSLKKAGIEVDIHTHDNSTFYSLGSEQAGDQWRDLQLFMQSFAGGADPYYALVWFTSQQLGQWNWERFSDKAFDHLNDVALATTNNAERKRMYQRMQDIMEESGCYRFITNGVMPKIIRSNTRAIFAPDGYPVLKHFRPSI
jgi:peptide/nickel transport system substrate-binding protein